MMKVTLSVALLLTTTNSPCEFLLYLRFQKEYLKSISYGDAKELQKAKGMCEYTF